jgi:hypothetical protein
MSLKQTSPVSRLSIMVSIMVMLVVASPVTSKLSLLSNPEPFSLVGSGNVYQYSLANNVDFTEAKYPITITSEGLGADSAFTFKNSIFEVATSAQFKELRSMFIANHNDLVISGYDKDAKSAQAEFVECGSQTYDDQIECKAKVVTLDAKITPDSALEAVRFDDRSNMYVTAWRSASTNKLFIYLQATGIK